MSTATLPTETPAVTPAPVPVEPDFASMFYNTTEPADVVVETVVVPAPESEPGIAALPEKELAASTETALIETPPVGTETKEKPAEDKGHAAAARRLGSEVATLKKEFQTMAEENRDV